jgi:Transposase IS4
MAPDMRKVIGTAITCRATQVTSLMECNRRYGTKAKEKILDGIVINVITDRSNPTSRVQTYIEGEFDLGNGRSKIAKVHLRYVNLKELPPPPPLQEVLAVEDVPAENPGEDVIAAAYNEVVDTAVQGAIPPLGTHESIIHQNNQIIEALEAALNNSDTDSSATEDDIPVEEVAVPVQEPHVCEAHGVPWYAIPVALVNNPLNGPIPYKEWGLRLPTGTVWRDGVNIDESITRLDVFLQMFPKAQLHDTFVLTNIQLRKKELRETSKGELLKFFGIMILTTRYEFNNRSDLWSDHPPTKYESAAQLGRRTGMSRKRFDDLWTCIRFSMQPDDKPEDITSETYRWMLVDGFIRNFNQHRATNFIPSEKLCVDESFSRWYGQGGNWINHGLPMFVSMDRKPEDGCEIQNTACGKTGIMCQLKLVKTSREAHEEERQEDETGAFAGLNHGTKVLLKLTRPWWMSNRVVVADSYFASVECAKELLRRGMKFAGVVKTSHREFPLQHLQQVEMGERGERYGLVAKNQENEPYLMAFVWLDRERRYFVTSCSSLAEGQPYVRHRWRQLVSDLTTPPERIELTIPQPAAAELFYTSAGKIDQHNRDRQATLGMETKLKTHDWSMRVNMTLLSMCIVDSWRVWTRISQDDRGNQRESQKTFYGNLAAELIDNSFDRVVGNTRNKRRANDDDNPRDEALIDPLTGLARSGEGIHLRRCHKTRKNPNHTAQGRCKVCQAKTRLLCSECAEDNNARGLPWICNPETGRMCFATHRAQEHAH